MIEIEVQSWTAIFDANPLDNLFITYTRHDRLLYAHGNCSGIDLSARELRQRANVRLHPSRSTQANEFNLDGFAWSSRKQPGESGYFDLELDIDLPNNLYDGIWEFSQKGAKAMLRAKFTGPITSTSPVLKRLNPLVSLDECNIYLLTNPSIHFHIDVARAKGEKSPSLED